MIKAENSRRVHQKYEAPHFGESWSKLFFSLRLRWFQVQGLFPTPSPQITQGAHGALDRPPPHLSMVTQYETMDKQESWAYIKIVLKETLYKMY